MNSLQRFFKTSVGRKYAMALSALFLMIFLTQHLIINLLSVFSSNAFNQVSHFMGTNPLIQFVMQPVLIFAVLFHFIMGFALELKNQGARSVKYVSNNGAANSSWVSRNMLISGITILLFLALHFYDFWIPEMNIKYIQGDMSGMHHGHYRYYDELVIKFVPIWRVVIYCLGFIFLGLHLHHGFSSAFQSVGTPGADNRKALQSFGKWYAIIVPLGFVVIALYHHINTCCA